MPMEEIWREDPFPASPPQGSATDIDNVPRKDIISLKQKYYHLNLTYLDILTPPRIIPEDNKAL